MLNQMTREDCLSILCWKAAETGRLPKKSDFTEYEVARIKSFFGPWPRALEAAGLKPPKSEDKQARNLDKHIRTKRRKTEALKAQNQ